MIKLSILIPVYNETHTILEIVNRIQKINLAGIDKEIIIIDDFSNDGTREKIKKCETDTIKVLCHDKNLGKGAALRSGFSIVRGDYVIIQDADLEYDPRDYSLILQPLLENKADVVYGSRFIGNEPHRVMFFWHYVGNKLLTFFSNMLTNLNLTDMETCYKAFKADILKKVAFKENRFGFEPEFTAKVAKLRLRIYEVGISYYGRTYAEGKKINWKDGISALWCIIRYNLFRR
jgi:glycosyltransferase involved in cell wall biosynthesis